MKLHSHNYTVEMDLQSAEFLLDDDGLAVFTKRLEEKIFLFWIHVPFRVVS